MRRITFTALTALAVSAGVPAMAQDVPEKTAIVDYGDLDLTNPEHMRMLDQRLLTAAKQVCGSASWINRTCVTSSYQEAKRTLKARRSLALASRD